MTTNSRDDVKLAEIGRDIFYIKEKLNAVDVKVSSHYVTKEEFEGYKKSQEPINKIVYGMVGLILVGVVGAVISLVLK